MTLSIKILGILVDESAVTPEAVIRSDTLNCVQRGVSIPFSVSAGPWPVSNEDLFCLCGGSLRLKLILYHQSQDGVLNSHGRR